MIAPKKDAISLNEIEEIGLTLLAYESNYLYKALGMAISSINISHIMGAIETINHLSTQDNLSYFEEVGKQKVQYLTSKIESNYYNVQGNPRNEIKLNFNQIKKLCIEEGYDSSVIPLLVSVMKVRAL
ncbi:hypothetical protein QMA40_29280 (plasmid) [Bacillus thuringiensis]|uniref:hypothetical protein n=1 Tax=Bacillus thuringiensis TaxID=1428 RepID=UPI00397738AD